MITALKWGPAAIFSAGIFLVHGLGPQRDMELRAPLDAAVPPLAMYEEWQTLEVSEWEARVVGFDDYLLRGYSAAGEPRMTLYVGWYGSQTQGSTIHSPKNCLPGGGWEPLYSSVAPIETTDGRTARVNRYVIQRDDQQALVLYWYQGRGRVAHNEYAVKFDLLRDAAIDRRSDEALVRIVIPIRTTEEAAAAEARDVAAELIPALDRALPAAEA